MKDGLTEWADGTKCWYLNGTHHRTDGPAIERFDGVKQWLVDGEPHRTDGPAIEWPDGTVEYWYHGKRITKKVFYSRAFQVKIVMEG